MFCEVFGCNKEESQPPVQNVDSFAREYARHYERLDELSRSRVLEWQRKMDREVKDLRDEIARLRKLAGI